MNKLYFQSKTTSLTPYNHSYIQLRLHQCYTGDQYIQSQQIQST